MRFTDNWHDYELIDCSGGERLERWGNIILIRPDPQVIWNTRKNNRLWNNPHGRYLRSKSGGGNWEIYKDIPDSWKIKYKSLTFNLKPMGFKHTGLFPEQAVNWDYMTQKIKSSNRKIRVLNLFAYTGGATLACLAGGAEVCHVDASKGMTAWAKENAEVSGFSGAAKRWIVDDCLKFVEREIRRGSKYDAVIMDPPSYGRGPGGEVWKIEEKIFELVTLCAALLSENPLFFIINSYTAGLSPSAMNYILAHTLCPNFKGTSQAYEIGLPVTESGLYLPCGATSVWEK